MNHRRRAVPWLTLALLLAPPPAFAAGGAHVIDDSAVETPGACHLETWATRYGPGAGLANLSPGCTRKAWPRLELGAGVQHLWDGKRDTLAGPALKYDLTPAGSRTGLALDAAAVWSLRTGRLEGASLIAPVSLPLGQRLQLNLNAGWSYVRASAHPHGLFLGAQAMAQLSTEVSLMAEAFGRDHGAPGSQFGLRWTPRNGALDVDLLAGRRVDGSRRTAITIGLTVRR